MWLPVKWEAHTMRAGNLLGLAVSPVLLALLGWRALFITYGILGGPLLAMWLAAVPDTHAAGIACAHGFHMSSSLQRSPRIKSTVLYPTLQGQRVLTAVPGRVVHWEWGSCCRALQLGPSLSLTL